MAEVRGCNFNGEAEVRAGMFDDAEFARIEQLPVM
jgi:hypothetical protein